MKSFNIFFFKFDFISGGHIAGMVSRMAAKKIKTVDKIGTIMALDPISIDSLDEKNRLTRSDAYYVEVIHTDGTKFGISETIGHGWFIINDGLV